ncbi:MAG TPA: isochorismatase family cysteine hydrolase [Gaiellaceae bacterium]|nr:isochorismatase family cysteine hydrolase [Gaiellaceae bacterium]
MKRLLWDVDTQVDFVDADGKLAVPGAEARVPAMGRLVEWARREGIPHIASADDHELTDPEISESPDYADTFPPHCLRGTRGAAKIPETAQADPVPLGGTEVPEEWLCGREFLIHKKDFDVFTNPNAERLLKHFEPDEIVLFGVATDICDDAAIKGLRKRGYDVTFVEDASCGIDDERSRACIVDWQGGGVRIATVDDVVS